MTAAIRKQEVALSQERRQQGFSLNESDDHILELCYQGNVIARFLQQGVEVDNVLKGIQQLGKN